MYNWFKANAGEIIGGEWEITRRKNDSRHIPDFWLYNGCEFAPVECKLGQFDKKALKQIERYMNFYGCRKGFAVAASLNIDLPPEIKFIGFDMNALDKENAHEY